MSQKSWLAFLASRRDSIVVPATNCLGYKFNRREDNGVDPNRDFSYTRKDNKCFLSPTSKVIYQIMKQNIIQLVVTYHGGMVAIGYEWGSQNHRRPNDKSPDQMPYASIGKLFSTYSGRFKREIPYPVGPINSVIYPVDGGMEDWLYAEGWDQSFLRKDCVGMGEIKVPQAGSDASLRGTDIRISRLVGSLYSDIDRMDDASGSLPNHSPSPRKRLLSHPRTTLASNEALPTRYLRTVAEEGDGRKLLETIPNGNRALVFLVETSDLKRPTQDSLGGSLRILSTNSPQNGHIPRNVRINLLALDLLQPYVCFQDYSLTTRPVSSSSTSSNHAPVLPNQQNSIALTIKWYVGGAFDVDESFLTLHKFHSFQPKVTSTEDFTNYLNYIGNDGLLDTLVSNFKKKTADSNAGPVREHELHHKEMVYMLSSSLHKGPTRWKKYEEYTKAHPSEAHPTEQNNSSEPDKDESDPLAMNTIFQEKILLDPFLFSAKEKASHHKKHTFWIIAWAKVDSAFSEGKQGFPQHLPPQSHYANLRTNSHWLCEKVPGSRKEIAPRECHGRRYWPSDFLELSYFPQNNSLSIRSVKECAFWQLSQSNQNIQQFSDILFPSTTTTTALGSAPVSRDDNRTVANASTSETVVEDQSPTPYPIFFRSPSEDVQAPPLLSTERLYILLCLLLALGIVVYSRLSSNWRRNQIYATLANNPYLRLPTGFQK